MDDGTERLRGQFRDAAQGGQADNYGGDRIEDTAAGGARRAERGVEALLKKRTGKGRISDGESRTTAETPTTRKSPAEPPARESTRIKTRETAAVREGGTALSEGGREGLLPTSGLERPQIRTRETVTGASSAHTATTEPLDRRSIKTKDAYIQSQPETYPDQPPQTIVQGQQGFTQEQGRKAAVKRTEARRTVDEAVSAGRGSSTASSVRRQARPGGPDITSARETENRIIRTARSVKKTPERTARHAIKTVERSSRKTIKTAQRTAKTATRTVKTAARTAKTAQKTAQTAAKASQRAVQAARAAAKAAVTTAKAAAKTTVTAVKAAIAAIRALITAIAAGGWVVIVIVIVICLIGMLIASAFGIFFADPGNAPGAVSPAQAVAQINQELADHLEALQTNDYDAVEIVGQPPAWADVLAVFAVSVAGGDGADASDVVVLDADRVAKMSDTFWAMTKITTETKTVEHPATETTASWTEEILVITITPRTPDDMRVFYSFSDDQNTQLNELLENRDLLTQLAGDLTITGADAKALLAALPEDLSPERRAVIEKALSLVGKVTYFWGGKSYVIGWDSRWGRIQKVTAEGHPTTGTYRPYGLDCSGFVDWVFYNATGGDYIIGHGGGAASQHAYCTSITWDEALPGDLVFYPEDSHVGIVGGRDEAGNLLIIHCISTVVISDSSGFTSIGRPSYYSE